jgi:hypothetical protein
VAGPERDDPPGAPATDDVTAKVRTLAREAPAVVPSDPWLEQTPSDVAELAHLGAVDADEETPPPRLPGFLARDLAMEVEDTGAEVEVAMALDPEVLIPEPPAYAAPPNLAEALRAGPPEPWPWLAEDLAPRNITPRPPPAPSEEVEAYLGDGPFAAPMDGPPTPASAAARFAEAFRSEPVPDARALVPAEVRAELARPHRLERRVSTTTGGPKTVAELRRTARQPAPAPSAAPPAGRHYPRMRALLQDPDAVPYGITPPTEPPPPPVPGTFFPAAPAPPERPRAADLDNLLLTMAEGLLIGEGPDGGTEVRVTLRDEFFAGTELRIGLGGGSITATLVPPDRPTYWALSGNVAELESRLLERGLRVQEVRVLEP